MLEILESVKSVNSVTYSLSVGRTLAVFSGLLITVVPVGLVLFADLGRAGVGALVAATLAARGDRLTDVLRVLSCDPVLVAFRTLAGAGVGAAVTVRVQNAGWEPGAPRRPELCVVAGRLLIGVRSELLVALEWALVLLAKLTPPALELFELLVECVVIPESKEWLLLLLPVEVSCPAAAAAPDEDAG